MDKSDIYSMGWLVILYVYLLVVSNFVPEGSSRSIAGMFGLVIIVMGIFVQDIVFIWKTAPYPYLRLLVRPSGKIIRLFIAEKGVHSERLEKVPYMWATTITAQFPYGWMTFSKVKKLTILHEYPWAKRVKFTPGQAAYMGYTVNHPKVENLKVYEYPKGSFSLDHGEPMPIFRLKEASQDYFLPDIPLGVLYSSTQRDPAREIPLMMKMVNRIKQDETALAETERDSLEWHRKSIKLEERVKKQDNEIRGLLEEKSDNVDAVIEQLLSYVEEHQTIENAYKHMKGQRPSLTFGKWIAITFIAIAAMVLLYVMRDQLGSAGSALNNPAVMIFAVLVVIAFCVLLYYLAVEKKGGGK